MARSPAKPPLTLVDPASIGISPPRPLGPHGTALWNGVLAESTFVIERDLSC
jgi:hypothetical protein